MDNEPSVVRPEGRLDMARAAAFKAEVQALVEAGSTKLVLDLGDVTFIDSTGLGAVVGGLKLARGAGGDLRIACLPPQAEAVLKLSSLSNVLPVYRSVEDALADFN